MTKTTKHILELFAVLVIAIPAAIVLYNYVSNTTTPKVLIALISLNIPCVIAALLWFWWRFLKLLPEGERGKRIIDWLALGPLSLMPASMVWLHYYGDINNPPNIWMLLMVINIVPQSASIAWLIIRNEKIEIVRVLKCVVNEHPVITFLIGLACLVFGLFALGGGR